MNKGLVDYSTEWTTSFVVGDDIVPRMSIEGFEELRDGVLDMICRIKIPKYQVTRTQQQLHDKSTTDQSNTPLQSILLDPDEVKDSKFRQQVIEFWKFQADLKEKNSSHYIELCPPGEIIELFKHRQIRIPSNGVVGSSFGRLRAASSSFLTGGASNLDDSADDEDEEEDSRPFTARRAHRNEFRRIIISSRLLTDHDPIGVKKRFQDVATKQFGLKHPFSENDLKVCAEP
jgi:hypothetical protein